MTAPPQIQLGVLGWADSLILMVLALVVFGPRRLPQIGRQIGKLMYEFRKASNDFKFQMEEELRTAEEADRRKKLEEDRLKAEAQHAAQVAALPPPIELPATSVPDAPTPAASDEDSSHSLPAAETEPQQEASGLVVRPPSTGEQVRAGRPYKRGPEPAAEQLEFPLEGEAAPPAEHTTNGASSVNYGHGTGLPGTDDSQPVTEQATHHG